MKIKYLIIFILVCTTSFSALAFKKESGALKNKMVFGISFPDDSSVYMIAQSIISISRQEYIAGTLSVSEITIDSMGNSQLRIYCAGAIDPEKIQNQIASRAPDPIQSAAREMKFAEKIKSSLPTEIQRMNTGLPVVYKKYPETTHAKVMEFAVANLEDLDALYDLLIKDFAGKRTAKNLKPEDSKDLPANNSLGSNLYILELETKTDSK